MSFENGEEKDETSTSPSSYRWSAIPFGFFVSILIHFAGLIALLLFKVPPIASPSDTIDPIAVQILSDIPDNPQTKEVQKQLPSYSQPPEALTSREITPATPPPDNKPGMPNTAPPAIPGMVRPAKMLSASVLSDPRSASAVADLATLAPRERAEQLCAVEAMAQLAVWDKRFKPDMVSAYAMEDETWDGLTLKARGGAIRSLGKWFNISFECAVAGNPEIVTSFAFTIGAPIPENEWAEHYLAAGSPDH